jgi:hypothetical protein
VWSLSRITAELTPDALHYVSMRSLFAARGMHDHYEAFRRICIGGVLDAVTKGLFIEDPWIDPALPVDERLSSVADEGPIAVSSESAEPEPEPEAEPEPVSVASVTVGMEARRARAPFPRSLYTWDRIVGLFKRDYGISVEWNGHPMLCRDGIRVRYPNPNEKNVHTRIRFMAHALRAFGIDRKEFDDKMLL